jgi:enediyne biosynthesis protein E7
MNRRNPISKKTNDGPPAHWLFGVLPEFRRDILGFLLDCVKKYGDVVRLPYGLAGVSIKGRRDAAAYLLNHPADIKHVLVTNQSNYQRIWVPAAKRVFGQGLLTSEDPLHLKQRRMMQPFFHHQRIAAYAQVMTEKTEQLLEGWGDGMTVDAAREMMRLTLAIVCKTLFGTDLTAEVKDLAEAVTVGQHHITLQYRSLAALFTPVFVPTRRNRQFRKAGQRLNHTIYGMIHARRTKGDHSNDLLSMLLNARDQDGSAMSDQQVRDEAMTLFLAGHDTTANALAWTWYLLSQHPDVESRLLAELKEVLGERTPSSADVQKLTYTGMVFAETMRLYPPAYILVRTARNNDILPSGAEIPAGTDIFMCQYVMHRNPRFFPDPERFDPERFSPNTKQERPDYAYFPFGGGPRMCIGEPFAKMEGILIVAAIAQRFKMTLLPDQTIVPEPLVTLRPQYGILMRLSKRS